MYKVFIGIVIIVIIYSIRKKDSKFVPGVNKEVKKVNKEIKEVNKEVKEVNKVNKVKKVEKKVRFNLSKYSK